MTSILAKSGIAGFQGVQGVSAIAGIESAHRADDIFGVQAAGQGLVQFGEASILQQVNTDRRFAARSPRDRLALAEHVMARSSAGASALSTFTGIENVEAAMLRRLAISPSTDKDVGSVLNRFAGEITPSSPTPGTPGAFAAASGWGAVVGGGVGALADAASAAWGGPSTAAATAPGDSARDSTLEAVGDKIVVAINTLIQAITNAPGYSLPPAGFTPPPASPLPSPSRPDRKRTSLK